MILIGNSLGKRQQDLNSKVNDAAAKNIPMEEYNNSDDNSDIFKLFKINLASKYKHVDTIIEALKSGDGLYISTAIKCVWLYDDEHSNFINPDYLHNNIFPFMSMKMKKKFLTAISTHVRNETRAKEFYEYCMKNKLSHFGFKFLIFTSREFKAEVIAKSDHITLRSMFRDDKYVVSFVGNDFEMAELYLGRTGRISVSIFSYLYWLDNKRYLNILEMSNSHQRLGLRLSKDIMVNHKDRVLKHINFYFQSLDRTMFCRYTTSGEAKIYANRLLPKKSSDFWNMDYIRTYEDILKLISDENIFDFIKNIFQTKYPEIEFEMTEEFYRCDYYNFMSVEAKESWALKHLANPNKSFLSHGKEDIDFLWYRFVNFDKAIEPIKKYVLNTPDVDKRAAIVNILVESAKNQDQLQKLFQYYYERHVNENTTIKAAFLNKVAEHHNIWEFHENCWISFNKLLYSIGFYDITKDFSRKASVAVPVLFYHILHKEEIPEGLKQYVSNLHYIKNFYLNKISTEEQKNIICNYLLQMYINKLENEDSCQSDCLDLSIANAVKDIFKHLNKPDEELPEIVVRVLCKEEEKKESGQRTVLTTGIMIRSLKQDSQSVLSQMPFLEESFSERQFKISTFLRKLKVYFSKDLAKDFLKYFVESLESMPSDEFNHRNLFAAVHGIFVLADESFKKDFLIKYVPSDSKVDYSQVEKKHLYIQQAICSFACYSRPPVPLNIMRSYIKGDYVKYCLDMIYMYAANLPPQSLLQFVKVLINAPVAIKTHGLRLAFQCFNLENIKNLTLKTWNGSQNKSLRKIIFTGLHKYMLQKEDEEQLNLYKVLLTLTSQLKEDDEDDIFDILTNPQNYPDHLKNDVYKTAWMTVNQFPEDKENLRRRAYIINNIRLSLNLMDNEIVTQIIDEYLKDLFTEKHIMLAIDQPAQRRRDNWKNGDWAVDRNDVVRDTDQSVIHGLSELYKAKFHLTITYMCTFTDEDKVKSNLERVQLILKKCLDMWNVYTKNNELFSRSFCHKFINCLIDTHIFLSRENNTAINALFEYIAKYLHDYLPMFEVHLLIWRLRILIITNNILHSEKTLTESYEKEPVKRILNIYATEVVKTIKEFVDQDNFSIKLVDKVSNVVGNFLSIIRDKLLNKSELSENDVRIFFAEDLLKLKIKEVALLAISILPVYPVSKMAIDEHENAIKFIKESACFEIQAAFYNRTVAYDLDEHVEPPSENRFRYKIRSRFPMYRRARIPIRSHCRRRPLPPRRPRARH